MIKNSLINNQLNQQSPRKDIISRLELFKRIINIHSKIKNDEKFFNNEFKTGLKCSYGSEHDNKMLKYTKPACMGDGRLDFRNFGSGLKWLGENSMIYIQKRFDEFPLSGFCEKCQYKYTDETVQGLRYNNRHLNYSN